VNMTPEVYTAAGVIVNLIALLIAVSRILTANTASEIRSAERMISLERDVTHLSTDVKTRADRIEKDVQTLYDLQREHLSDFHQKHT
jgi:hypothetical protein